MAACAHVAVKPLWEAAPGLGHNWGNPMKIRDIDVLVVGAGPTGLAAAIELRRLHAGTVVVLEREEAVGGTARPAGNGLKDLNRALSGPGDARHYVRLARAVGAELVTSTTASGWLSAHTPAPAPAPAPPGGRAPDGSAPDQPLVGLITAGPAGPTEWHARAVLLATGCADRSRPARPPADDWATDHNLARAGDLEMDSATNGPAVDESLRTSRLGVFAAGNLTHAAVTADLAAIAGRHAARAIGEYLSGAGWPTHSLDVVATAPLTWVHPQRLSFPLSPPPGGRFLTGATIFDERGHLELSQAGQVLHREVKRHIMPNRSVTLRTGVLAGISPDAGPVTLRWVAR